MTTRLPVALTLLGALAACDGAMGGSGAAPAGGDASAAGSTVSINAGGASAAGFLADANFSGGSTYSTTNAIDTSRITGTVPPQAVFQTERYGEFTYTVPNLTPNSPQAVTLYFEESYWTAAGQRTFDVAINGATVLTAFDILAQAGGTNRAIARTFSTNATSSGQVVIQFTRGGGPDWPKLCGITLVEGGSLFTLSVSKTGAGTGTVTSSPAGISCGGTCSASYAGGTGVTLTAAATGGSTFAGWTGACSGTAATCTVSMGANQSVTASFNAPTTGVSVNAGGAATGDFLADAYFSGGSTYSTTNAIDTAQVAAPVPPQAVFQTERFGEFTYTLPGFAAGTAATVTLYFQESYWTAAGQRTFDVAINGTTVLTAFDIFAQAGGTNRAIARTFTTSADSSGQVVIQFTRGGGPDWPKISGISVAGGGGTGNYGPCDIYQAANTPCVAAHSTVRALYGAYAGNLYQVRRASDRTTRDIPVLAPGGYANSAIQDSFCANTTCTISTIYDQSPNGNHLTKSPPGGWLTNGGLEADATAAKITASGHPVYGVYTTMSWDNNVGAVGYRNNGTRGVATGDQPETMYMVASGRHYNQWCCFDYGNAETNNLDNGPATMEAVYFGSSTQWGRGSGTGPWVMADLEDGVYAGGSFAAPATNTSLIADYVTAMLKGYSGNRFALKGGDAQSSSLTTLYDGTRPAGYSPQKKEGAIILGTGGDNSHTGEGTFYEGCITSGVPSDATDSAVQANIAAAGYGR